MQFFIFLLAMLACASASPVPGNLLDSFLGNAAGSASATKAKGNGNGNGNGAAAANAGNAGANTTKATPSKAAGNGTAVNPVSAAASTIVIDPGFDTAAAKVAETDAATAANTLSSTTSAQMVTKLKTASSALEKVDLMSNDSDWKFDFRAVEPEANGQGGGIVTANIASFPPTEMTGTSMAVGTMGPCGFATPHSHPRANELNLITEGSLVSAMTLENKARVINQTIGLYQMTVFPQGSMHMEFNPGCSNATFVAAFSSNDAGVQQSMTAFTNFGDEVVKATMGGSLMVDGKDIDTFKTEIPVNVALGVESCLKACGLQKRSLEESREVLKRGLPSRTLKL